MELLVDDFFTYIYPIYPLPHEPSFRAAFKSREDLKNSCYMSLLASMIGVTVLSLPRRSRNHFNTHGLKNSYPGSLKLADRCHKAAIESRGAGFLDKDLTVYDAITSFFLGLAATYKFQWNQARLYYSEAMTITKIVSACNFGITDDHQSSNQLTEIHGRVSNQAPTTKDYIKQEMARRVFWTLFVSIRSIPQFGANFSDIMICPRNCTEPYPPLPLEVDDEYIFVDHIIPQPSGYLSRLTGNNLNVKIYDTLTRVIRMEITNDEVNSIDWYSEKKGLELCLFEMKQIICDTPPELLFSTESLNAVMSSYDLDQMLSQYRVAPKILSQHQNEKLDARKRVQLEVQKANIYASQVATRYFIIEKYRNLLENQKFTQCISEDSPLNIDSSDIDIAKSMAKVCSKNPKINHEDEETKFIDELENVIKEIVGIICSLNPITLEAYGVNFRIKMRHVISTIISSPQTLKGPLAIKMNSYMNLFLDYLTNFDRIATDLTTADEEDCIKSEEEELRNWANLRQI